MRAHNFDRLEFQPSAQHCFQGSTYSVLYETSVNHRWFTVCNADTSFRRAQLDVKRDLPCSEVNFYAS